MEISIVSPVYRGEKMLDELVSRIEAAVNTFTSDYEIIFVNDASPDNSWIEIQRICSENKKIKALNLSRNYGQECPIKAGMSVTSGNWIVVMDCDLQDRPEEIPNLYHKAKEGYDVVHAQRIDRQDSYLKKMSSTVFHLVFNWLSGTSTDKTISNFGIYSASIIKEYNKFNEQCPDFLTSLSLLGFRNTKMPVQHSERAEGESSYNLYKLLKYAIDCILCNTNKPLRLSAYFGSLMSLTSILMAIYNVVAKLLGIIELEGFTTTVFSIWFVGGLILAQLGIIGLYLSKVFDQVKNRPVFTVQDYVNFSTQ